MTDTTTAPTIAPPADIPATAVGHVIAAVLLLLFPALASNFFTFQIGAYSLIMGTIALSLMVLAGYGGMVSLAQMSVAGIAGYMIAIFGANSLGTGLGWPWFLAIPAALIIGSLLSVIVGLLAIRTEGIYMIVITLAIATAVYFFTQQNVEIFNGHSGFSGIAPPWSSGSIGARQNRSTISRWQWPQPPTPLFCTHRAPPSASASRPSATTPAAWKPSVTTSPRTASRPLR